MEKFEERDPVVLYNHNQKMFGTLHRPLNGDKFPGVLICHGLAGHKTGKHRVYVLLSELLAKMGIASLRFDFRGSGDSEGDFIDMTLEGEVEDSIIALDYLKDCGIVDPSRVGIFGRSFGGSVAVLAAARTNFVKGLALWAPIFNSDQWQEQFATVFAAQKADKEINEELLRFDGQKAHMNFWYQFFDMPIQNELSNLNQTPLLHIHGDQDSVVHTSHAEQYQSFREHASADSRFIRLKYSDHDFSHPEEQVTALEETANWFANTL